MCGFWLCLAATLSWPPVCPKIKKIQNPHIIEGPTNLQKYEIHGGNNLQILILFGCRFKLASSLSHTKKIQNPHIIEGPTNLQSFNHNLFACRFKSAPSLSLHQKDSKSVVLT